LTVHDEGKDEDEDEFEDGDEFEFEVALVEWKGV
jgi:hypothetical protein